MTFASSTQGTQRGNFAINTTVNRVAIALGADPARAMGNGGYLGKNGAFATNNISSRRSAGMYLRMFVDAAGRLVFERGAPADTPLDPITGLPETADGQPLRIAPDWELITW